MLFGGSPLRLFSLMTGGAWDLTWRLLPRCFAMVPDTIVLYTYVGGRGAGNLPWGIAI